MSKFAPEELLQEAYKLIAQDKARLSGTNYPVYKGQTISPMSDLTQRSRELRNKFASNPAPYSGKLQTVLGRNNQGLSQRDVQGLIDRTGQTQRGFAQGPMLRKLQQQFPSTYAPYVERYNQRTERDIGRSSPELAGNLGDIQKASNSLEGSRNSQIVRALQGLQQDKQNRRQGLVTNLEQFGNQKHAYNNMVIQGDKNRFNQEANEPYQKIQLLEQALAPHAGAMDQGFHPDIAPSKFNEIAAALRAYGIDPSKPSSEWNNTRQNKGSYPGQLVAPLPGQIQLSHDVLGRMKSNLQDNYTGKRRAITNDLVGNDNLSTKALQNVPPAMQGQVDQVEREARERMKKDLANISNQYVKLGQFGSPQHIADTEKRTRELNKAVLEQRNKLLQGSLTNQLQLQHGNEISNIGQLNQLGQQSHKDYGDLLQDIRSVNQQGANAFNNDQREHEELYKNYQNERLWEWPHMRTTARNEGRSNALGEVFRGLEDRNISLDNLARLNTNYSELQRDSDRYRQDLLTTQQARDELQRKLGIFNQQKAASDIEARRKMEMEMNARREKERLSALQSQAKMSTQTQGPDYSNLISRLQGGIYGDLAPFKGKPVELPHGTNFDTVHAQFARDMEILRGAGYYPKYIPRPTGNYNMQLNKSSVSSPFKLNLNLK